MEDIGCQLSHSTSRGKKKKFEKTFKLQIERILSLLIVPIAISDYVCCWKKEWKGRKVGRQKQEAEEDEKGLGGQGSRKRTEKNTSTCKSIPGTFPLT